MTLGFFHFSSATDLIEAGRQLFTVSREKRASKNDGDRLRKYIAKFKLHFDTT